MNAPAKKRGLAGRLLRYAMPYWKALLLSLGLILVVSASINYLPVLIKQLTDQCLLDTSVSAELRLDRLGRIGILYLSIAVVGYSLRYVQGILTAWIGQRIIYGLRVAVFKKALRMQQAWFDRMPVGTLMTRVTSDIERLENFVAEGVVGTEEISTPPGRRCPTRRAKRSFGSSTCSTVSRLTTVSKPPPSPSSNCKASQTVY